MDKVWVGRKLMAASGALAERFTSVGEKGGPGVEVIQPVVQRLITEIGLSIVLGENDVRLPFSRTRGMVRIPTEISKEALTKAFNGLTGIVSHYVHALPGATQSMDEFARGALAHAAKVTLLLRDELNAGVRNVETERMFGGLALLIYAPQPGTEQLSVNQ